MPNIANQPFADALAKTYPAPEGVKIFTAGEQAEKMLAFWSVKQDTTSSVLRIGDTLFRVVQHSCPHCKEHLSAQAVRMSKKEREMMAALMSMIKSTMPNKPASAAKPKQAKQAAKPAPVQAAEPSEEDITLEQLDALTTPGGGA